MLLARAKQREWSQDLDLPAYAYPFQSLGKWEPSQGGYSDQQSSSDNERNQHILFQHFQNTYDVN